MKVSVISDGPGVVSGEQYVNGDCALNAEYYKDVQESSATADGIAGKKIIGAVEGMEGEVFEGALPDDTEVICYFFSTNDNDYKIVTLRNQPTKMSQLTLTRWLPGHLSFSLDLASQECGT